MCRQNVPTPFSVDVYKRTAQIRLNRLQLQVVVTVDGINLYNQCLASLNSVIQQLIEFC